MLNAIAIVVGSVVIGGSIIYADQTVQRVSVAVRGAGAFSEPIQVDLRDVQLELKKPDELSSTVGNDIKPLPPEFWEPQSLLSPYLLPYDE